MAKNNVRSVGCTIIEQGDSGAYTMKAWYHTDEGRMHDEASTDLSWQEALTVLVEFLDEHRPGWAIGDGWSQPPMFG